MDDRFNFDKENLYTADYPPYPETIEVLGFEYPISIPRKPPKSKMRNYGLPLKEQKFQREHIPGDIKMWPKRVMDEFVSVMWHKRRNGEWWIIGGQEIYVTGKAWTFFNFWHTEQGTLPEFRMEAVEFFLVWEFIERDRNCLGLLDIKPRRIGDTEKTLFIIWEYCSRVRYQRGGMQNVKDDAAEKNFKRLVKGHNKMTPFFKPFLKGSDSPSQTLEFAYPEQRMTRKKISNEKRKGNVSNKLLESNFKFKPIESSIDFEASVQGRYDGERLGRYHLDEPGKITAFNIREQWPVIRRTLTLNNDRKVVGKSIWTTTVEDYKKGKKTGENMSTMANIKFFWDNSNPKKRDGNGRTITGLYRYFRSCIMSDEPDEFGFYNETRTIETINNTRKSLEDIGDWEGLAQFKRQYPLTIQDVFTLPIDDCVLMPVLLDRRKQQIEDGLNWRSKMPENGPIKPLEVRGDLIWIGGQFGGNVEFYPNPTGRWYISQFPIKPNYRTIVNKGVYKPGNDEIYSFGVDPYDHMVEGKAGEDGSPIHSRGAGAVYRKYDESVDGNLEKDDNGDIEEREVHQMQTDTFVCVYANRPQDPYEFYEDMLKTAIYYGVQMFFEKDKPGVGQFFRNSKKDGQSFASYLKDRPKETRTEFGSKKREKGTKASAPIINLYVDALKWHVIHRVHNYHHHQILEDFRKFKVYNRTECDLTVACGFALLAAGPVMKKRIEARREEFNNNVAYFRKYNRKR